MRQQHSLLSVLWQQNRVQIGLIILLFVIMIGGYAVKYRVVDPYLQHLSTAQFRLQQQVRQRQVEFSNSGIPVSTAEQIKQDLEQFNSLIPEQEFFSTFLGELFSWAQESGLGIHQISYNPEREEGAGLFRYGLGFSVNGDYMQLKKFLYLLENSKRMLIIDKISLSGINADKNGKSVNLRIELTTFFQERSV